MEGRGNGNGWESSKRDVSGKGSIPAQMLRLMSGIPTPLQLCPVWTPILGHHHAPPEQTPTGLLPSGFAEKPKVILSKPKSDVDTLSVKTLPWSLLPSERKQNSPQRSVWPLCDSPLPLLSCTSLLTPLWMHWLLGYTLGIPGVLPSQVFAGAVLCLECSLLDGCSVNSITFKSWI